jgi:hypothetical protein
MQVTKKQAHLDDWAIVRYPEIVVAEIISDHDPEYVFPNSVFADLNDMRPVSLFGRASNDYRKNQLTGEFADGNRVQTTRIVSVRDGTVTTKNTDYTLGIINDDYRNWCETHGVDWREFSRLTIDMDPEHFEGDAFRHMMENFVIYVIDGDERQIYKNLSELCSNPKYGFGNPDEAMKHYCSILASAGINFLRDPQDLGLEFSDNHLAVVAGKNLIKWMELEWRK